MGMIDIRWKWPTRLIAACCCVAVLLPASLSHSAQVGGPGKRLPVAVGAKSRSAVPTRSATRTKQSASPKSARTTKPTAGPVSRKAPKTPVAPAATQLPAILYNEYLRPSGDRYEGSSAPYIVIYQQEDPGAESGRIDPTRVVSAARRLLAENPGTRWGMLDFEEPYNDILLAGPSDPRYGAARASMIETVRAVKREFPQVRWTYYGMPRLPYWTDGRDWSRHTADQRRALFEKAWTSYGPILNELDWIQPTVYDKYERARGFPLNSREAGDAAERAFRTAHVEVVREWFRRTGQAQRPLYPVVTPWFLGTDKSTPYRAIPMGELRADQVDPLVEAGVDGISVWSSMHHKIMLSTIDFVPTTPFSRWVQPIVRETFARDILGRPDAATVEWTRSEVKAALQSSVFATMDAAMASIREALSRPAGAVASGSER